jgi:hypothetical protein
VPLAGICAGGGPNLLAKGRPYRGRFFCYHQRTTTLEDEVAFFNRRLGTSRTLVELLSLRRQYRRSFAFVIRCLPTLAWLHLRTARDNRFARAA